MTLDLRETVDFEKGDGSENRRLARGFIKPAVGRWGDNGLFPYINAGRSRDFAFVVLITDANDFDALDLDDPNSLFSFAYVDNIYALHSIRRAYDALRMLRATLRTNRNTADLSRDQFQNVVPGNEGVLDAVPWGECPLGGARIHWTPDGNVIAVAVAGFSGRDNDHLAKMLTDFLVHREVKPEL